MLKGAFTHMFCFRRLIFFASVIAVAFSVIGTGMHLATAQNENSILFVAPNRVVIASKEDIAVVNVSNRSSEARRYDLTVVDQIMNAEGMTKRVDDFPYSAKRLLRFQPKRFTLQPGERQVIRIMARREKDLAAGDYHSHILFREVPLSIDDKKTMEQEAKETKTQFEIRTLYGVAIPVIVQNGEISSKLELVEANYVPAADGMPDHIAVDLKRSGNAEASGILRVRFEKTGQAPININNDQWIPVYREVDNVTRRVPLNNMPKDLSLKGGKMIVEMFPGVSPTEGVEPTSLEPVRKEIAF